ncbi:hypothetical protein D3C87_1710290 [compost metagenome]
MPRPIEVAMAAPVKPNAGTGPKPLISTGHKMMLAILAIHKLFMAMAAFPAPLKIPLIRKSRTMITLPPIMMRMKGVPCSAVSAEAPMSSRISLA